MPDCRICLRDFKKLRFQTKHLSICAECVDALNSAKRPAHDALDHIGALLRKGIEKREPKNVDAQYQRALPGWINRLLANRGNRSLPFQQARAHRRGLLRLNEGLPWDYPADWIERAHRIRVRDGMCCAGCGATGATLDVHHIVYLSNWGTNRQENLVTLCRPCHEKEHGRVFDVGEAEEPGNPDPIRPLPPPPLPARKPVERPTSVPLHTRVGDKVVRVGPPPIKRGFDARMPTKLPPDVPGAKAELAPEKIEPRVDLRCPSCFTELTIPARSASSGKMIRCPVCTVSFDFERTRRPAPLQEASLAPPPAAAPNPAVHRVEAVVEPPVAREASRSHANFLPTGAGTLFAVVFFLACMVYVASQYEGDTTPPPQRLADADPAPDERQLRMLLDDAMRRWPYLSTADGVEATREMIQVRNRLIANGTPPVEALRSAIEQVAPKYAR